jgi:hypothetical protein
LRRQGRVLRRQHDKLDAKTFGREGRFSEVRGG